MGILRRRQPRIDKLARKGDTDGLRRALTYRDTVRLTDGRAEDLGAPVRRRAMSALREVGGPDAVAGASEALVDGDAEVRLEAIRALGDANVSEPLIEQLIGRRGGADQDFGDELRSALVAMDNSGAGLDFAERLLASEEAGDGEGHEEFLHRLLSDATFSERQGLAQAAAAELATDDPARRARAGVVLFAVRDNAGTVLRAALDQPHRAHVADALGRLRDNEALSDLTALLDDGDPDVRAAAARALGDIRDPRAVEGLVKASTDKEFAVREAAIASLDALGTSAIVFAFGAFVRPLLESGRAPSVEAAHVFVQAAALEPADDTKVRPDNTSPSSAPATLNRRRAGRVSRTARWARAAWRDSR